MDVIVDEIILRDTEPVDMITSWTVLCDVYKQLAFIDTLTDEERIAEFKKVVKEINRFLTRARSGMLSARNDTDVIDWLVEEMKPKPQACYDNRYQIAFYKLKQEWIAQQLRKYTWLIEQNEVEEETDE